MKTSTRALHILFFVLAFILITSCNIIGQQKDVSTSMPSLSAPTQTVKLTTTLALPSPSHTVSPPFVITTSPEATATKKGEMLQRCQDVASQLTFSPDSKLLAATCSSGIYIFDLQTFSLLRRIRGGMKLTPMVGDFSPDGQFFVSGGNVNLYQVSDGALLQTLSEQKNGTQNVSFSADGKLLAESSGGLINIWRVSNGVMLNTIDPNIYVTSLAFAPAGSTLAVGGYPHKISLWETSNGIWLRNFTGHTREITSLAFSPDGKTLASGSFDGTAKLWSVKDGKLLYSLEGATAPVSGVSFSPDGQILATSSHDGVVRLWEVSDGTLIRKVENLTDHWVTSVAYSPDGRWLAASTDDGKIYVWSLDQ